MVESQYSKPATVAIVALADVPHNDISLINSNYSIFKIAPEFDSPADARDWASENGAYLDLALTIRSRTDR